MNEFNCYISDINKTKNFTRNILINCDVITQTGGNGGYCINSNISVNRITCNIIHESNHNTGMIFLLQRNINNNNEITDIINDFGTTLEQSFPETFKAFILIHKEGYFQFPNDGFKTICNQLPIDHISTYYTKLFSKTKNILEQNTIKGCYNYNIHTIVCLSRKQIVKSIDVNKALSHCVSKMTIPVEHKLSMTNSNIDDIVQKINLLEKHLIITIGPPGIGKTLLSEKLHGTKMRYIRTKIPNKKVRENVSIYLDELKLSERTAENLIIDGENSTEKDRQMFIKSCQVQNMPCICIFFNVEKDMCLQMNSYIFNKSQGHTLKKSTKGISRYYNRLQYPRMCEGFCEIQSIIGLPSEFVQKIY
jgi:hypothetical protein